MTYIENVLVCLAAPLLMAMFCMGKKYRHIVLFCLTGMGICLLSSYLNAFFAGTYHVDNIVAATQIAPVVEETMKFLPLLFYFVIFDPDKEHFKFAALLVATGFATLENVCYLMQNGAEQFVFLLIRGFGTGAMHIICGSAYGHWMNFVWDKKPLRSVCLFGILCITITYHAIYNLFVSFGGVLQIIGYFIPVITVALGWLTYLAASLKARKS